MLAFHKERVRSLSWNTEIPWMLITASDDNMVAIWDVRTHKVVSQTYEPTLALTAFATHPKRPFSLISTHFDSSIIFWSLLSVPDVALAQYKMLFGVESEDLLSDATNVLSNANVKVKLCGTESSTMQNSSAKLKPIEK